MWDFFPLESHVTANSKRYQIARESESLDLEELGVAPNETALFELAIRATKWPPHLPHFATQ
jgi:hypothetical protein